MAKIKVKKKLKAKGTESSPKLSPQRIASPRNEPNRSPQLSTTEVKALRKKKKKRKLTTNEQTSSLKVSPAASPLPSPKVAAAATKKKVKKTLKEKKHLKKTQSAAAATSVQNSPKTSANRGASLEVAPKSSPPLAATEPKTAMKKEKKMKRKEDSQRPASPKVLPTDSSTIPPQAADDKNSRKVFVGGVPFETDEATLRVDFEECGEIEELLCLKDDAGRFKGVAFVTYKTMDGVKNALKYDGDDYGGRTLKVSMATNRRDIDGKGGKIEKGKGKGKDGKGKDGKGKGKKGDKGGKDKGDKGKKGKSKGKSKDKDQHSKGKGHGEGAGGLKMFE